MDKTMVSVPVEPTEAMLKAAHAAMLSDIPPDGESTYGPTISTHAIYRAYWAAMLSAAPAPQPVQGEAVQIAAPDHIADARKMVAAPGDTWPATEADEAAMAQADDAGNPAWWRGHDEACTILCQKVHAILDGKDTGRGVANEPWESTRRRLLAAALRSQGQADAVDDKCAELIYAVGNKYPGESRHETALRYIRQAEAPTGAAALAQQANKEQPPNA
jgi:hypothetical protein